MRSKKSRDLLNIMKRVQNHAFARTFRAWHSQVSYNQILSKLRSISIQRLMHKVGLKALMRWQAACADTAWQQHRSKRVERLMQLIHNIAIQAAGRCVSAWKETTVRDRRVRLKMNRVLMRIQHREAIAALMTWVENAADRRRQKHTARRILKRWTHKVMSGCIERWRDDMAQRHNLKTQAAKVLYRMMKRQQIQAFECW